MDNTFYSQNIEKHTIDNNLYRNVIWTDNNKKLQLVLMSLKPNQEIGNEKHETTVQFIRVEKGNGMAIINNKNYNLQDGSVVIVPQNTYHNIINTGNEDLKLYTLYTPSNHVPNLQQKSKPSFDKEEEPNMIGGNNDKYYSKYLKYKNKYNSLKIKLNK